MYCKHCYRMLPDGTEVCTACGKSQTEPAVNDTEEKSIVVELLLCIFLGVFGAHRFYTRKYGTAILYLITRGLFYIGWIVDIILIIVRMAQEKNRPDSGSFTVGQGAPPVPLSEPAKPYSQQDASEGAARILSVYQQRTLQETTEKLRKERNTDDIDTVEESPAAYPSPRISTFKTSTHRVAGMEHYMDNILDLATENDDYNMSKREIIEEGMVGERIWKYEFAPIHTELVPEPDNPYDPKAIKVIVDGEHVGYIKKGSCAHVHKLINEDRIQSIECEIGGGQYKIVEEEEDDDGDETYTLYKESTKVFVHLTVYESTKD